jgi:hypothetical protein
MPFFSKIKGILKIIPEKESIINVSKPNARSLCLHKLLDFFAGIFLVRIFFAGIFLVRIFFARIFLVRIFLGKKILAKKNPHLK